MDRVGVRELKQNASAVLRRVKAGESVEVTERGQPVALLIPIPQSEDRLHHLIALGKARAAKGNLADLTPRSPRTGRPLPSEILDQMRADER